MISETSTEKVPLIQVFLSSFAGGANERTRARDVVEGLPKDLLLASGFRFKAGICGDSGPTFLAVLGTSRTTQSSPVDASMEDVPGGAGQIR